MIVNIVLLSPTAKYSVANSEPKYIIVNGTLSGVIKCFTNDVKPHSIEKLAKVNTLPKVKKMLNFRAANRRTGMYKLESVKNRRPIPSRTKNAIILSFRDKVQQEELVEEPVALLTPEPSPLLVVDPDRNKFPNLTAISSSILPVPVLLGKYFPMLEPTLEIYPSTLLF